MVFPFLPGSYFALWWLAAVGGKGGVECQWHSPPVRWAALPDACEPAIAERQTAAMLALLVPLAAGPLSVIAAVT